LHPESKEEGNMFLILLKKLFEEAGGQMKEKLES
jgi:hypothetical protein